MSLGVEGMVGADKVLQAKKSSRRLELELEVEFGVIPVVHILIQGVVFSPFLLCECRQLGTRIECPCGKGYGAITLTGGKGDHTVISDFKVHTRRQ